MALSTELLVGLKSIYAFTGSVGASWATSSGMLVNVCAIAFTRSASLIIRFSRQHVQRPWAAVSAVERDPGLVHVLAKFVLRRIEHHFGVGERKADHLVVTLAPPRLRPLQARGVLGADGPQRGLAQLEILDRGAGQVHVAHGPFMQHGLFDDGVADGELLRGLPGRI